MRRCSLLRSVTGSGPAVIENRDVLTIGNGIGGNGCSKIEVRIWKWASRSCCVPLGADRWHLTTGELSDVFDGVCRLDEACGGLPKEWSKDIWVMLSRTNRMNLGGLLEALGECAGLGGMYRGADWACDELLSFVEGWRAPYGLSPLTERQRDAMADKVRRACERSGGRIATHWMLTLNWMATERFAGNDIYGPMLDALDYCVKHGGLDAPNGKDVMEGYLGPPPESNPEFVMLRIAREASNWLGKRAPLPGGGDGYSKVLDLLRTAWRQRGVLEGEEWGGGESWPVWFGCEWIRLCREGTDPVPALVWLHILDNLRQAMGDGSERLLVRINPVSMCEKEGEFNLAVDDPNEARHVMETWGATISGEISRVMGRAMRVDIWDDDSNVWSVAAA